MNDAQAIVYALLGGILPALIWLAFWLHEDSQHPEPRGLIVRTFLLGMAAVIMVLPFQTIIDSAFPNMTLITILALVMTEEVFKFGAAYLGGLRSIEDNEPIDPIIYMITAALGFVALENALFVLGSLIGENIVESVITGNLRFIGASLLHVVSSSMIGLAMAFSFYRRPNTRFILTFTALVLAIVFHAIFNLAIIQGGDYGALLAFAIVWVSAVFILLAFEKVKTIARSEERDIIKL